MRDKQYNSKETKHPGLAISFRFSLKKWSIQPPGSRNCDDNIDGQNRRKEHEWLNYTFENVSIAWGVTTNGRQSA